MSAAQAYAIGAWVHEFPMTPEVVLEAIERAGDK
jgi:DNA replication protein DnaD